MNVQENVGVFILDAKEVENISGPVHFIFHDLLEELFDVFESLLG